MAFEEKPGFISEPVYGDLSAYQFYLGAVGSTGFVIATSQGQRVTGILYNKPAATGRVGQIAVSGTARVIAGGTITKGAILTTTAAGKAETASSGDYVFGKARESAVDGDIFGVELTFDGVY
jgi:hypothetical protein